MSEEILPISFSPNADATNTDFSNAPLQLSRIDVNPEYRKKWKVHMEDFLCLTRGGKLIRETLYRTGAFDPNLKDDYFMLLKHVEAIYDQKLIKGKTYEERRHLEDRWVILDKNGNEKVEFPQFKHGYLAGGCIYSIESKYYNIETGEYYGYSTSSMQSDEFVFIDNRFEADKAKRGVMKINKRDGSWELFPFTR